MLRYSSYSNPAEYDHWYGTWRPGSANVTVCPAAVERPSEDPDGCTSPFGKGLDNNRIGRKLSSTAVTVVDWLYPSDPPYSVVGRKKRPTPARKTSGFLSN